MKLCLALKPSPIEEIHFKGRKFLVKRDDLTEFIASGNKVRKLEYLLGEAVKRKADVVITCGALQSNHARATTYLSIKLGMKPVLFLKDWHPGPENGNFFLNSLMGAEIHIVTPKEYENVDEIMKAYAKKIEKEGGRAYIIPEGGSNALGALGYVDAAHEMDRQVDLSEIDAIYLATSSAGTHAGLLAGLKILGYKNIEVRGVVIHKKPKEMVKEKISRILKKLGVDDERITLIEGFEGPEYAVPSQDDLKIIKEAAEKGLLLDPVYTAKAFRGMVETAGDKEKVIFLHTGGVFGLFAQYKELEEVL